MKEVIAALITLALLGVLIFTLWHASAFFTGYGTNYSSFIQQARTPIGEARVGLDTSEEELWQSANPNSPGVSPFKGKIRIDTWDSDAVSENAAAEYIALRTSTTNTEAIPLAGWSVHSLVSDIRIPLPKAVLLLRLGEQNPLVDMHVAPGEYVYIVTGSSPAGDSFHTNSCIGQLANYYEFFPRLPDQCPTPQHIIAPTLTHLKNMGEKCLEYIASIPACEIPRDIPKDLLPACRAEIEKNVTYPNCVEKEFKNRGFAVFNGGGWYSYLNQPLEIWRNKYDVIRLLDTQGRVVDVWVY
jgi:hypothetical protein